MAESILGVGAFVLFMMSLRPLLQGQALEQPETERLGFDFELISICDPSSLMDVQSRSIRLNEIRCCLASRLS